VGELLRRLQTPSRFLPFPENDLACLVSGLIFKTDPSSFLLAAWSWPQTAVGNSARVGGGRASTGARCSRLLCPEIPGVKCERSEVRGQHSLLDARLPVAHEDICFFILLLFVPSSCAQHLYLFPISSPDLPQQKRNRLESQNHSPILRALWWHACPTFPAKT
jgi:hypothetical protein